MATTKQKRNSGSGRSLTRTVVEHSALFSGGLNTEISDTVDAVPYTSDECNCDIRANGSRSRRLGMDFERGYQLLNYATAEEGEDTDKWAFNTTEWVDVKDRPGEQFLVVQTGLKLFFYKNKGAPYSSSPELTEDGLSPYYVDVSQYVLEEYRGLPSAEIKSMEDGETLLYSIDVKGLFYDAEGVLLGSYKKEDDNENKVYKGIIENENGEVLFKIEEGFLKDAETDQNVGKVFAEYKVVDGKPNWTVEEECKQSPLRFTEAYGSLFVCGKYIQTFCMRGLEPPETGTIITSISKAYAVLDVRAFWNDEAARQYYTERSFSVNNSNPYFSSAFLCYEQEENKFDSLYGHESGNRGDYWHKYKMPSGFVGVYDANGTYVGWIEYDNRSFTQGYDENDYRQGYGRVMLGTPVEFTEEYLDDECLVKVIALSNRLHTQFWFAPDVHENYSFKRIDDFGNGYTDAGQNPVRTANYYARVWNSLPYKITQGITCTAKTPFEGDRTTENASPNGTPEYLIFETGEAALDMATITMQEVFKTNKNSKRWFNSATKTAVLKGYARYSKSLGLSLKIRDFEGVMDIQDFTEIGGDKSEVIKDVDFRLGNNIERCPQLDTPEHRYNLQNQGWTSDKITLFYGDEEVESFNGYKGYPANNMQWFVAKKDFTDGTETIRNFKPAELLNTYFGGTIAPRGHYILEYFNQDRRTASGLAISEEALAETSKPRFKYVTDIIAYAGRIFYLVGDTVLYSQVIVEDFTKADKCYQEADPTSETISDIVDTDGGMIVLSEIGTGLRFAIAGGVLAVVGDRATALIGGGTTNIFTATAYTASSLMTIGSIAPDSFVSTEGGLFYWSTVGVARLSLTGAEAGYEIVSENTIQTFFDNIPDACVARCKAVYDKPAKQILWMYPDEDSLSSLTNILKYNIQTKQWTRYKLVDQRETDKESDGKDASAPFICAAVSLKEPFKIQNEYYLYAEENSSLKPLVDDEGQYIIAAEPIPTEKVLYSSALFLLNDPLQSSLTFGNFNNNNHQDWAKADYSGDGYDYESYLVSHPILLQAEYYDKTTPYLLATFRRTEQGFDLTGKGIHPSACQGSIMWDWPENGNSGKWDAQQELYRYDKGSILDGKMVSSKTRVYGSGRALQIRLSSVGNKGFIVENVGLDVYVDRRI